MLRGLYTATTGLSAIMLRNDIETNNLTNTKTIGYKKEEVVFQSFQSQLIDRINYQQPSTSQRPTVGSLGGGVMIGDVVTYTNVQGQLVNTGRDMDIAINNTGYLVVQNAAGENNYTRNGSFSLNQDSQLVTDEGYPVLGQKGPLEIKGQLLKIEEDGQVFVDGEYVDTLLLVDLVDPQKVGNSLFESNSPTRAATGKILQGYLEQSNADPIEGMTKYLKNLRAYEANQKVVQAYDSTLEKVINEVGRV